MQCGEHRRVIGSPLDEGAQAPQISRFVWHDARVWAGNKTHPSSLGEDMNKSFARIECLEICGHGEVDNKTVSSVWQEIIVPFVRAGSMSPRTTERVGW